MSDQTQHNGQTRQDDQTKSKRLGERRSIPDAARALGISEEAVRGRIKRGSLDSMKVDGQVFVLLHPDQTQPDASERSQAAGRPDEGTDQGDLVEALRERIEHLSKIIDTRDEEIRRRDTIIMSLSQRIPELEAPTDQRDTKETVSEDSGNGAAAGGDPQKPTERRSWWWRFFGFE